MWTDYFDKILLINLAKRTDRLAQATEQLNRFNIPFERAEAIENKDGAEGLRLTMVGVFERAIENNWQNILIFEDDLDIIEETFTEVMEGVVLQVPPDYNIIYLGCQLTVVPKGFYWTNLLRVTQAYATHAAIYSRRCIEQILKQGMEAPVDNWIVKNIKECYAVYPMLVSQIISKSDIYTSERFMNWKPHLEEKYERQIQKMKETGRFIQQPKSL